jgi:D-alanyl-D-alanine carboxypeptidase
MTVSTNRPKKKTGQLMESLKPTTRARRSSRRHLLTIGAWLGAAMIAMAALAACGGEERQVSDELDSQLQQILDSAVESPKTGFPGTALRVSQPELGTWSGAAGEANIDPATPMRPSDTFRAGSIMKPFIATVVLQLVEEEKLALDDRLPAVLPHDVVARVADGDRITVRMLLNHTSGIPEYSDKELDFSALAEPHRIWKVEEFLDRAAARPRPFEPGKGYAYSNTDYNLLGLVIEHATSESWRAAVREQIIDRLGLKHTSLPEPGHVLDGADLAHGYEVIDGKIQDVSDLDPSMAGAAGGNALVTSTEDLSRFLDALLAGKLFEKAGTLDAMLGFVRAGNDSGLGLGYGLGLERYDLPGGVKVIGHFGTAGGYRAFVGYAPAQKIGIAIAFTTGQYAPGDPTPVIMRALELMVAQGS